MQPSLPTKSEDQKSFFICSVEPSDLPAFQEALSLAAVPHKVVTGHYTHREGELKGQGVDEQSFLIPLDYLAVVTGTGYLETQESILVLGAFDANWRVNGRPAHLAFLDLNKADVPLGAFRSVSQATAHELGDYTIDGSTYYACQPLVTVAPRGHLSGEHHHSAGQPVPAPDAPRTVDASAAQADTLPAS